MCRLPGTLEVSHQPSRDLHLSGTGSYTRPRRIGRDPAPHSDKASPGGGIRTSGPLKSGPPAPHRALGSVVAAHSRRFGRVT